MEFLRVGKDLVINLDSITTVTRGHNATYIFFIGEDEEPMKLEGEKATALWNFFIVFSPNICPEPPKEQQHDKENQPSTTESPP